MFSYAQSPGGIPVAAWYKADASATLFSDEGITPVTTNTTVWQWNEVQGTGHNLLQSNSVSRPVFSNTTTLANFNPTVTFDGSNDWMQFTAGAGVNIIDRANGTLFAAGYMNILKQSGFAGFHASMDFPGMHFFQTDYKLLFFTNGGPGYQGKSPDPATAQSFFTSGSAWQNGTTYASATVSLNGTRSNYEGSEIYNVNPGTGYRDFRIGADNNYGSFSGQLNEVMVFEDRLTASQMDQVESYMAIKYGTTYANGAKDYKNSAGVTVWSEATNSSYNNNIAGIARDDNGALYQKQAWSSNSGKQVLIGIGGLSNTNASNAGTLNDGQYLIWGDNGMSKYPSVAETNIAGTNYRFASVWKVQNTGSVGMVRVAWPAGFAAIKLVQSTDATFASGNTITDMTAHTQDVNGVTYNYADVTLVDGQYFTFSILAQSPGGIATLPAVWYRPDNATTSLWKDASINNLDLTSTNGTTVNSGNQVHNFHSWTTNYSNTKYYSYTSDGSPVFGKWNDGGTTTTASGDYSGGYYYMPLTVFGVARDTLPTGGNGLITGIDNDQGYAAEPGFGVYGGKQRFYRYGNGAAVSGVNASINASAVYMWRPPAGSSTATGTDTLLLGLNGAYTTAQINPRSSVAGPHLNIGTDNFAYGAFPGDIQEIIWYKDSLDYNDIQKVETYLALKYGTTLAHNYVNATGDTIYSLNTDPVYHYNIAGIGREEANGGLDQRQSNSVNTGSQVLIGTSGLANTNEANATSLTEGQFLLWGDNGLAKVPSVAISGSPNVNFRFASVWKVQNTGSVGDVRVAWVAGLTNLSLIQNNDPTFATGNTLTDMSANITTINGLTYNYADVTLANGQYFTFGTQLNGPGGVAVDLRVWLRSDAGFNPDSWTDFSGNDNNYTQTNTGRQPFIAAKQYNFNPMVDFGTTGADARFMVVPSGKPYSANGTSSTIFTATTSRDPSGYTDIIGFGGTTTGAGLANANSPTFTKQNANLVLYPYTIAPSLPAVTLNRLYLDDVSYQVGVAGIKYGQNGQITTTAQTFAAGNALHANGSILGSQPEVRNGNIGEVIAYQRDLTEPEKQRVRSYVAIKYGLTLPHNYIASNATTIFWDITANTGYNNNIAGIARDDHGSLNQRQSHSINAGRQVLISTPGLANSNATNASLLSDQQFLLWGDNNLAKAPTVAIAGVSGVNYRFASIWKVQNTNGVGTVRVAWPKGYANLKLIQSPDAVIEATDMITDMLNVQVVNGVSYAYADVTISDGQYFTFAAFIQAPGGVTNGLSYWYRADVFAEAAGDGADVTSWTDFTSGVVSSQIGTAVLPKYKSGEATYFNFNPGINFDTYNASIGNIAEQTLSNTNFDIFTLTKEGMGTAGNSRILSIGRDNTTFNSTNFDNPGLWPNGNIERRNNTGGALEYSNPGSIAFATDVSSIMYYRFTDLSYIKALNGAAPGTAKTHTAMGLMLGGHVFGATNGATNLGNDNEGFTGHLGDLIIYGGGNLTPEERNKVDTYLGIKYGVTLNSSNNYTTSQDVIVWDATANSAYYHNVAGIGRDFVSALHQKQSRSQHANTNSQVAIGLGNIAATNSANTNELTDGQFLLWGDNGNTTSMTNTAGTYTAFTYAGSINNGRHMNRIWKVQNTDVTGEVKIRFPQTAVGSTAFAIDDCADYAIIYADDAAFTANVVVTPVTLNGADYEAMHSFPNGTSYFTFGKVTPMNAGTVYLPDVVETTNEYGSCGTGEWTYYHKASDPVQNLLAVSGFTPAEMNNFDITITAVGTAYDDGIVQTKLMPRITTIVDNGASFSNGKVRVYYSPDELNNTGVSGSITNGWFKYEGDANAVIADVYSDGLMDGSKAIALIPDATGIEDGVHYVEFHNISSFSSFIYISSSKAEVLPVTLLHFNVVLERNIPTLKWATATEQMNRGFDIERSGDSRNWDRIGFVSSSAKNGSSSTRLDYTYTDNTPLNGTTYYRLKQGDFDGKYEYSQVRIVNFPAGILTKIIPNPVSDILRVQGLAGKNRINITNMQGQVLMTVTTVNVTARTIDISRYAPGMYFISITNEKGKVTVHKVIKK
jgi:hypothetical protein